MRAPVIGEHERREVRLVADEHEVVAVALGQAREIAGLEAEQGGIVGERRAQLVRDDLGRLVRTRVRARDDALRGRP